MLANSRNCCSLIVSTISREAPRRHRDGRGEISKDYTLCDFYASWCINRRVDGGLELPLKLVSARLGHASIQMTADRYGHLFPSADDGTELAAADKALLRPRS